MNMSELVKRLLAGKSVWENGKSRPNDTEIEAAAHITALEQDFETFKFSKRQTEEKLSNQMQANEVLRQENALLKSEREAIRAAAHREAAEWHVQRADEIQDANSKITGFMMQYDNAKLNPMDKHHRACADAILALSTLPPEAIADVRRESFNNGVEAAAKYCEDDGFESVQHEIRNLKQKNPAAN
jgi:hypothetical protein